MKRRGLGKWIVGVGASCVLVVSTVPVAAMAKADPCRGLRGVTLPDDNAEALVQVQRRIIKCAGFLHETAFAGDEHAQCVPFAYALMDRLRPPQVRYSSGGDTAGDYFYRLQTLGKTSEPLRNGRPKKQKRPLFVWWSDGMDDGHVAVYIGGDLYIDSQAAFLVGKHDMSVKDPSLVAWNLRTPREQVAFARHIWRPWPRSTPSIPDGYSSARVNGGSCLVCNNN